MDDHERNDDHESLVVQFVNITGKFVILYDFLKSSFLNIPSRC